MDKGQENFNFLVETFRCQLNCEGREKLKDVVEVSSGLPDEHRLVSFYSMGIDLLAEFAVDIVFIKFDDFSKHSRFPRYPDDKELTHNLKDIDRDKSLLVFISHCWLRGHENAPGWDGRPHPDNANGDKYRLCVEGIQRLKTTYASRAENCFVWLDFACMNQDNQTLNKEMENYDKIIQVCDCLFTPIYDPNHESWHYPVHPFAYGAALWNQGPYAYLNRAWCRVEMLCAAYLTVLENRDNSTRRFTLFDHGLRDSCQRSIRPHFVFGTKDLDYSLPPLILPPLRNSYLEKYHPTKGVLSVKSDMHFVNALVGFLGPARPDREGYEGSMDAQGRPQGYGTMYYKDGGEYEGQWMHGLRHGRGIMRFSYGDVYEGQWQNDQKHGEGIFRVNRGTTIIGEWQNGVECGDIRVILASGVEYRAVRTQGKILCTETGSNRPSLKLWADSFMLRTINH